VTLGDLLAELIKIENRLKDVEELQHLDIDAGALNVQIEVFATITNTVFTSPYPGSKKAKSGYFENLSNTDDITVARTSIGGVPAPNTKGYIMNRAPLAGQGGGTFTFTNVDLANFAFITSTNSAQSMASVYFY